MVRNLWLRVKYCVLGLGTSRTNSRTFLDLHIQPGAACCGVLRHASESMNLGCIWHPHNANFQLVTLIIMLSLTECTKKFQNIASSDPTTLLSCSFYCSYGCNFWSLSADILWTHTTRSMCVAHMTSSCDKPTAVISRLPDQSCTETTQAEVCCSSGVTRSLTPG